MLLRLASLALALSLAVPSTARAFGFLVGTSPAAGHLTHAELVVFRDGTLTALTVSAEYEGPEQPFALVVPVGRGAVAAETRMVPFEVLARLDGVDAPRLVERWERDPCAASTARHECGLATSTPPAPAEVAPPDPPFAGLPEIPAHPARTYRTAHDVTLLEPASGAALVEALTAAGYVAPAGLAEAAQPLVERGYHFLVARMEPSALHFHAGRAWTEPLRVHWREPALRIPTSIAHVGLAADADVVAHVIARSRLDVASGGFVAPTNVIVADTAREPFDDLYAALASRLLDAHPGVMTEYAWNAQGCEACPAGHALPGSDIAILGANVLYGGVENTEPVYNGYGSCCCAGWHVTPATVPRVTIVERRLDVRARPTAHASRGIVRRVVRRHANEVRFCYEQELAQRPDLAGQVTVAFIIGPTGSVMSSSIERTTLANARVESCITTATRRWTFPAPGEGEIVGVRFPIELDAEEVTYTAPREWATRSDFVLTRLHGRVGAGTSDWELVPADPIRGGREHDLDPVGHDAAPDAAPTSRFTSRFVVRHPWTAEVSCETPVRGLYGAAPDGTAPLPIGATIDAAGLADAELDALLVTPRGDIGLPARAEAEAETETDSETEAETETETEAEAETDSETETETETEAGAACGCRAVGARSDGGALALLLLLAGAARRRPRGVGPA